MLIPRKVKETIHSLKNPNQINKIFYGLLEIWLPNLNGRIPPCYRARSLLDPSRNVRIYKNKLVSKKLMDPEKERDENDYYHQRGG